MKSVFDTIGEKSKNAEKHPFRTMELGDTFEIPNGLSVQSMRCLAYQRGETLGMKFKVSKKTRTVERVK